VLGQSIASYNATLNAVRLRFADRDFQGRGSQTFDLRITVHALTAIESALLDLFGQFLGLPVAALLGKASRGRVSRSGYLFFIGDSRKTDLNYRLAPEIGAPAGSVCAMRRPFQPTRSAVGRSSQGAVWL